MQIVTFEGFGGVALEAEVWGEQDAPAVLLLPAVGETRMNWRQAAQALADAGRHAICLDPRGSGGSAVPADGRQDLDAHCNDLRQILRQLPARPVVVARAAGGQVAVVALGEATEPLASGLVLVGPGMSNTGARAEAAAARLRLPTLILQGNDGPSSEQAEVERLIAAIQGVERVVLDPGANLSGADATDAFSAELLEFLERRLPLQPAVYEAGSDPRTLRAALGSFATGITVVTTFDPEGKPVGLTANSFTSVSLDPPLILFCVDNKATSRPAFEASERFAINVLHIGQQTTSNRFSTKGIDDRFAGIPWEQWEGGSPILTGSLANFDCVRHAVFDAGDHRMFIGRVLRARFELRRDPLLYFSGKYRRLHFA